MAVPKKIPNHFKFDTIQDLEIDIPTSINTKTVKFCRQIFNIFSFENGQFFMIIYCHTVRYANFADLRSSYFNRTYD